ncbi:MAG TPA: hypothetical protein VGO92_03180 [Acidimicrobiales bacterium]|nr:hypothetical protein [Acidimicrobiales bacterium]
MRNRVGVPALIGVVAGALVYAFLTRVVRAEGVVRPAVVFGLFAFVVCLVAGAAGRRR